MMEEEAEIEIAVEWWVGVVTENQSHVHRLSRVGGKTDLFPPLKVGFTA